eukprot:494455-Rhodomonas_salina.2
MRRPGQLSVRRWQASRSALRSSPSYLALLVQIHQKSVPGIENTGTNAPKRQYQGRDVSTTRGYHTRCVEEQ